MAVSVLLADDNEIVLRGLQTIIESDPEFRVVAAVQDGEAAVEAARAYRPDLAVIDVQMPRLDGLAVTQAVTDLPTPPKVLIMTTFNRWEYIERAMCAGAIGFLLKDTAPEEILHALRVAAGGQATLSPAVLDQVLQALQELRRRVPQLSRREAGQINTLTSREREVLGLMGRGWSNAEIAAKLFMSEATVKGHVSRILSKLGAPNRVHAAIVAYRAGLVA